MIRETKVKS